MEKQTVWQGRPPWRAYTGMFVLAVFIAALFYYGIFSYMPQATSALPRLGRFVIYIYLAPVIIALLMVCSAVLSRYSHLYTITEKYITACVGLIRKDERSAPISQITDTRVNQGVWDRLFGTGSLYISTPGSSSPETGYEICFAKVLYPFEVKKKIVDLMEKQKV